MLELISLLKNNNIKFSFGKYAYDEDCIIIKKNNYKLMIYFDNGFVCDLQSIPYTWGEMGSCSLSDIFNYLQYYLNINLNKDIQLSLF